MDKRVAFMFAVLVFNLSFVAAEISISEPLDTYNLGDRLYITINGVEGSPYGNLDIDLVCPNSTTSIVKIPANSFSETEEVTYSVYKTLEKNDLDIENYTEILGDCRIDAGITSDKVSTKKFKISDEINLDVSLDKENYNPGEGISLRVNAVRANGDLVDGTLSVSGATSFNKAIVNGFASESFSMPDTTEAGFYTLNISAYDSGSSGKLNTGEDLISFEINQVPSFIQTSLSDDSVSPGDSLSIGAEVFDQAGKEMDGSVLVRIISPEQRESDFGITTGDFRDIKFDTNATAGYYRIISRFEDVTDEREVQVLEVQKVDFLINDTILVISNVGNVVYNKTIDVQIGNDTKELDLSMGVGEIRKFSLKAPRGEYTVTATDGDAFVEGAVLLTGRAVSVQGVREGEIASWAYLLGIIVPITAFGLFAIVLLVRSRKTKVLVDKNKTGGFSERLRQTRERFRNISHKIPSANGVKKAQDDVREKVVEKIPMSKEMKSGFDNSLHRTTKSPSVGGFVDSHTAEDDSMIDLTKKRTTTGVAESSAVIKGEKHRSAVVCLNIRNYSSLGTVAKNHVIKIVNKAKDEKGLVDWKDNFVFIVYSPIVTRTYSNEQLAAKAAFGMKKDLESYNNKFKHEVDYNIGVHVGDLVSSKENGKLKYTSLGNTIALAKKISMTGSKDMLVSDDIRRKLLRDLKLTKSGDVSNHAVYSVSEIKNREANEAKLKDLLSRMKE